MRCIKCGNDLFDGAKFCKYCGLPVQDTLDAQTRRDRRKKAENRIQCPVCGTMVKQGNVFCTYCGEAIPQHEKTADFGKREPAPRKEKQAGRKGIILFIVLSLVIVAGLISVVAVHYLGNRDNTEENLQETEKDEVTQFSGIDQADETEAAETYDTGNSNAENEQETVVANSDSGSIQNDSSISGGDDDAYDVDAVIYDFLDAFVDDICNGTYSELYSVVEYGSEMEKAQKNYIANSDLYEELINCEIIDKTAINSAIYHVTVVEEYDVYNYTSYTGYYIKQKCVYEVRKQSDSTWKVGNYVGSVEQIEKVVY